MDRILNATNVYIQGEGAIDRLGEYCKKYGNNVLVLADDFVLGLVGERIEETFKDFNLKICKFNLECSNSEIKRVEDEATAHQADFIVGIGGGKTLDTVKAAGTEMNKVVVVSPTLSSSDAPITGVSVVYTDQGELEGYRFVKKPDCVIIDLKLIAGAPSKMLVGGMGDALATYIETKACYEAGVPSLAGGEIGEFPVAVAKLCFDTLLRDGKAAISACDKNQVTSAFANVVEANTYLSGMGFENSSISICHSFVGATTINETLHKVPHGLMVGFGILVQLVMENDHEMMNRLMKFFKEVGLPLCFADLGFTDYTEADLLAIAEASFDEYNTIANTKLTVTPETLKNAIIVADAIGSEFKQNNS